MAWTQAARDAAAMARKMHGKPKTSKTYSEAASAHRVAFAMTPAANARLKSYHKEKAFKFDKLEAKARKKESSASLKEFVKNRSYAAGKANKLISRS